MKFKELSADKDYENIYYFLKNFGLSERYISSLRKQAGLIFKNNEIANTKTPLKKGDKIKLALTTTKKTIIKPNNLKLDIVYEDEFLLIVNKPSLLSSSPSKSHYDENLAGAIVNYMYKKDANFVLRMINRLDKDTSGMIIVAKDLITYSKINNIDKTYHAIVSGKIEKNLVIDKPIKTINNEGINEIKRVISADGRSAKTFVTPIKPLNDATLVKIKLEQGRTHQIRVHLSSIGHPLIGDNVYGVKSNLISHTALICNKISFLHPFNNKQIELETTYPKDFIALIEQLSIEN